MPKPPNQHTLDFPPGSLVRYRKRDWIVLPSPEPDALLLRPPGGGDREKIAVSLPLARLLEDERPASADFQKPAPGQARDLASANLFFDAARLLLRDGAAPFLSFGRLSIRPRPYQIVPLILALRQDPVRLLIADDVGTGKTIEAGLILRELLDRRIIRRFAVLCPPWLCEQWRSELSSKFHLDAVVIRSGTVGTLERQTPPDQSIFEALGPTDPRTVAARRRLSSLLFS